MFMPAILLPFVLATLPVHVPIHAFLEAQEHQTMPSVLERKVFELRDGDMARPASERFDRTIYGYYPYWADHDDNLPGEHLDPSCVFLCESKSRRFTGKRPQLGHARGGAGRSRAQPRRQSRVDRDHVRQR